jgi:hypothetical protein
MTRQEAIELLDAYDADPDGFLTCNNPCTVADALLGQPEETARGEPLTSDALREMVDAYLDDDEDAVICDFCGQQTKIMHACEGCDTCACQECVETGAWSPVVGLCKECNPDATDDSDIGAEA